MSAVSCEQGPGASADLLNALIAAHQSTQSTAKPMDNLASLMELAAALKQHSSTRDGVAVAELDGQHQHQSWHLAGAAEHQYSQQQEAGHQNGTCTVATVTDSAQEQKADSIAAQATHERLNHRSSSRRRKPKVACSSAYGPNEHVVSHFDVKEETYDSQQPNVGQSADDGQHPAGLQTQQAAAAAAAVAASQHMEVDSAALAAAAALMANGIGIDYQQHQWGNSQLGSECYMDTADACYGQKQKQTACKAAGRKRAGTNNSARSTASRGSSMTAAGAAAVGAAIGTAGAGARQPAALSAQQRTVSGGLSDGTDSGMLDDTLVDPLLDGSSAAGDAAVGGNGLKSSNKQERLKEKNRLAQRRFRARQKTMLEQMQIRMDELAKQVDQRGKELTTLHQENQVLKIMVQEQQKVLMVAMVAQQQQQDDAGQKSASGEDQSNAHGKGPDAAVDAAAACAVGDGSSKASDKQQFQQLQQMYQEHWQQQQLQQLQTALR